VLAVFGAFAGRWLPVFHLFRQHPRILLVAALPIAYLVGVTTQALFVEGIEPAQRRLCFRVALALGALAFLTTAGVIVARLLLAEDLRFDVYWYFMPVFFIVALWLLRPAPVGQVFNLSNSKSKLETCPTAWRRALPWAILLVADLWALTW